MQINILLLRVLVIACNLVFGILESVAILNFFSLICASILRLLRYVHLLLYWLLLLLVGRMQINHLSAVFECLVVSVDINHLIV